MRQIKTMTKEELLTSSVDLVSKTYIGLGQNNIEEDTIMIMSKDLAKDLKRIYKNFYIEDAENAFYEGIRMDIKTDFIHFNIPIYISVPEKDLDLFNSKNLEKTHLIKDETICEVDTSKPGWIQQQIVKANFWNTGICKNYLCIDSDSYFIKPFKSEI